MTHDHTDDVLKDLETALAVEPSPEFAAHVRARIGEESARRRPWLMWATVGLVGAAVVVLAVVTLARREAGPAATQVAASHTLEPVAIAPAVSPAVTPAPVGETPAGAVKPQTVSVASRKSRPEVLVPRDQAAALGALVAGLNDGTIDPGSLATPPPAAATALAPAAGIVIAPIVIPPVDPRTPGSSGGESPGGIR
jgi:hypothetical protein